MVCVVMIAGRGCGGTVSDGVERWRKTRPQVDLCVGGGELGTRRVQGGFLIQYLSAKTIYYFITSYNLIVGAKAAGQLVQVVIGVRFSTRKRTIERVRRRKQQI